jgi:hypothetical protein
VTGQAELMELMEDLRCSQGESSPPEGLAQLQGSRPREPVEARDTQRTLDAIEGNLRHTRSVAPPREHNQRQSAAYQIRRSATRAYTSIERVRAEGRSTCHQRTTLVGGRGVIDGKQC